MSILSYSDLPSDAWLAVVIGNSRCHWALFRGEVFVNAGDTPHFEQPLVTLPQCMTEVALLPVYLASVVRSQADLWQDYPLLREVTLADIPLAGLYPTLGCDRALAVWGAVCVYDSPVLVVDAGTALTFTAATRDRLVGGAILPGLTVQLRSLHRHTAALPDVPLPAVLPNRWATNTPDAIASGVVYASLAAIDDYSRDWLQQFPNSRIVLTGGDAARLSRFLSRSGLPYLVDPYLAFWGLRSAIGSFSL
jgi:type III pantothenate kinase